MAGMNLGMAACDPVQAEDALVAPSREQGSGTDFAGTQLWVLSVPWNLSLQPIHLLQTTYTIRTRAGQLNGIS